MPRDGEERFILLTGREDRDIDALDALFADTSITYEMYDPNSAGLYIEATDNQTEEYQYYGVDEYVTIYYIEDDGVWSLWL